MRILWFGRSALEKALEKETLKRLEEEKQREEEEKWKEKEEEDRLYNKIVSALKEVIVFPGSKEEFEDFIGYKTEWVDVGRTDKGLIRTSNSNPFDYYTLESQKNILNFGVVALVNVQQYVIPHSSIHQYGVPVKKKKVQ